MKCPKCGEEMTDGTLRAESFIGGAIWMEGSTKVASIAKPGLSGHVRIEGWRCERCRTLVLNY